MDKLQLQNPRNRNTAGNGPSGRPKSRQAALGYRCFSKSGWGTGLACSSPSPGTVRIKINIEIAQQLSPEAVWGAEIAQSKYGKYVGPKAPHILYICFAQSRPPDPIRTHLLINFNTLYYSLRTWAWTTTTPDTRKPQDDRQRPPRAP